MMTIEEQQRVRRHRFWLGVVVATLALITTAQNAWWSWEQQKCNEAFAKNLAARVSWANEDREALNHLIITVFERRADHRQLRAYRNWLETTQSNDQARARVSLPALADCE